MSSDQPLLPGKDKAFSSFLMAQWQFSVITFGHNSYFYHEQKKKDEKFFHNSLIFFLYLKSHITLNIRWL